MNLITELADPLRQRLTGERFVWSTAVKYGALAVTLVLTIITGAPLFEVLSPIGIISRAIAFTSYSGLALLGGILLLELSGARRGGAVHSVRWEVSTLSSVGTAP